MVNAFVIGNLYEYRHKSKLNSLDYILSQKFGSLFNHFDAIVPKTTEFGRITQSNGHYDVQGNSMSLILVPIESSYATSY